MTCQHCKGTGRITLLFSKVACDCVASPRRKSPSEKIDTWIKIRAVHEADRMAWIASQIRGMSASAAWRESCKIRDLVAHATKVIGRAGNLIGAWSGACIDPGANPISCTMVLNTKKGWAIASSVSLDGFRNAKEDLIASETIRMVRELMEAGHVR